MPDKDDTKHRCKAWADHDARERRVLQSILDVLNKRMPQPVGAAPTDKTVLKPKGILPCPTRIQPP